MRHQPYEDNCKIRIRLGRICVISANRWADKAHTGRWELSKGHAAPTASITAGTKSSVLKIIKARNVQQATVGKLIDEFAQKIEDLYEYVRTSQEGRRLIIKIKSHVSEEEIYDDFAKIYRRYRALNRQKVCDYFFKETEDLANKLCDNFEATIQNL
ncbi:MAG: hypothetical protein HY869_02200 [Chloroflexi bacterium]|nr:hypothetical protein [Chloroflexota bacterium]